MTKKDVEILEYEIENYKEIKDFFYKPITEDSIKEFLDNF